MKYSEFREYCKTHPVELECIWRFGKDTAANPDALPVQMRGRRLITKVNSVGFILAFSKEATLADKESFNSELRVFGAKMCKLEGDILTIFNSAPRPATVKEQALLNEWEKIRSTPEFVKREEADTLSDGTSTYWAEVAFFSKHKGGEKLMKNRTYRIDPETQRELIQSKTNPGEPILRYKVYGLPTAEKTTD